MMTNSPYQKKDEQLFAEVQKLKNGDFSNSNAVYELSEKYIYKIINDIVKNHYTTEDLMQEAYIQIYNKIDTLQEVKAFYVWAGRIATNLTLRYIQKNSKEVLATPDEEGETDFIFDTAAEDNENFIPESVLIDREKQRLIAEIIDNLSTEQKICIQYFYYEEMSVNEIAEAMGCSAGTIKSRLNYARKSIKEAVVELDEKHGTRLYSLASAPLFLIVFRAMAEGLLPAVVGAASAVSVGAASVAAGGAGASVAGGASASVAGGASASVAGGAGASVAGGAGASVAGNAAGAGVASAASTAAKTASAVEKAASAGKINEVKNVVLDILKKAGTDLKTDAKKVAKAVKEMGKTNSEAIKAAFETGKKEGFKQILKSTGNVLGTTAKGFGASTLVTKVVTVTVAGALVATPIINGGGAGGIKSADLRINFSVFYSDNGVFYEQFDDEINGEMYPPCEMPLLTEEASAEEDILINIYGDDRINNGLGVASDSSALPEKDVHELISYGLQFKDCKGEVNQWGAIEYETSVNQEIIIEYNGEECLCSIEKVSVYTEDENMEEYRDAEDLEILYKKGQQFFLIGTIFSTNGKNIDITPGDLSMEKEPIVKTEPDIVDEELDEEYQEDISTNTFVKTETITFTPGYAKETIEFFNERGESLEGVDYDTIYWTVASEVQVVDGETDATITQQGEITWENEAEATDSFWVVEKLNSIALVRNAGETDITYLFDETQEFVVDGQEYIFTITDVECGGDYYREDVESVIIVTFKGEYHKKGTYATTHPGAAGIADPSEVEGIVVPGLPEDLPTVEPVSDMETLQAMLYEKYALFDNVTDEIVYERMSDVPCTVYLDDGSVHSVTLAECMFRDWSGYADVDRIEYDQELAQEIFSSYTKRTDSLID